MQTLTFTQKLLRQRSFFSSLIPLLALFLGLGASQSVMAQSVVSDNVTLNVSGTNGTYDTQAAGSGAGIFNGTNFGSFDLANSNNVLNISGLSFVINDPGNNYNTGTFLYRIYITSVGPAGFTPISLGAGSRNLTTSVRTFTIAPNVNLLAGLTGGAGTNYSIDVIYRADDNNNIFAPPVTSFPIKTATFTVTGAVPPPPTVTFSNASVTVDQGNGSVNYTAAAFNTTKLIDQKTGSTTAPKFDINTGTLVLKGGTLTTTETGARVVNGAFLDYIVYDNLGNPVPGGTGALQLSQDPTVTGGVRNFSLTTGTTNVIPLSPQAGNNYVIAVTYHVTYRDNGVNPSSRLDYTNNGGAFNGSYDVLGTKTPAPTINPNTIQISTDGNATPVSYFFPNNSSTTPQFPNHTFTSSTDAGGVPGAFDINNGQLSLKNTTVATTEAGTNTISSVVLYYRTRLANSGGGAWQPITLTQSGPVSGGTRLFVIDPSSPLNGNGQPNLIATPAVTGVGNYVVDVYYQANGNNSATGMTFSITYPPTGSYSANFTVAGSPIATTIWTGAINDNWFDAANWTGGIPTATTNALIRDLGTGTAPYPNINSGVVVNIGTTTNVAYDNTNSGPALVRNFIMGGSSQAQRSIARLVRGQLKVYGDFSNNYDSFIQRENTIMEFAGISNEDPTTVYSNPTTQTITGGTFIRVDISGGGKKQVTGTMNVSGSLNFLTPGVNAFITPNPTTALAANAGILYTDVTVAPPLSLPVVVLSDRAINNGNNGAQLNGETDISYLYGFIKTTRAAVGVNDVRTYGNMGMELTFTGTNAPGSVEVTRNTVEAYTPVSQRFGIRRIFGVRPADPATTTGGLQATMIFHYRTSETMNLGGSPPSVPGNGTIPEANLTIFVSSSAGNTFSLVGRDGPVDQTNKTVTKTGVRQFATLTLGNTELPLPVRLTAFDAKRIGSDALVTWQTASEENSKGYEVQVSTNGTQFRTLASVPSASPNTVKLTSYSYIDTEKNKAGTRYYRLHQVDLDGKEAFFAPVAVSFDGKATATTLVAYPNPFNGNDELHVAIQSATAGKGQLTITDMTGRTIRSTSVEVTSGLTDFTVNNMVDLKSGLYLVKFLLPSGEVKNLKIVKQ